MKKIFTLVLAICLILPMSGCGDTKVIKGVGYDTYGLINEDEKKNPDIQYEPVWGNIIWGILLVETVVAPIYFFGFSMFEPVGEKPKIKGQVTK